MKENHLKRVLSFLLVFAMVLGLCPTIVFAGDTLPYTGESALGENEPTSHGYRAEDLLTWDPATDPDAELLRARVPLQNRIAAVAATQANPSLNPEVEYLTLAGDYGNAFFGGTSYTNEFSEYCFNFWQYIDYYGPWHGQTTATTPFELWDSAGERAGTSDWQKRAFEFGMMNLPNAAYTNAAHKNGVLSLGCIFLPRAYQSWRTLIVRDEDGNFPYADKLVDIAEYYGFDGWFVNLEGSDHPSGNAKTELIAMLKYMRDKGQYIQYYNAGGSIDSSVMDGGGADSFFKDYGWSTSGAKTEVSKYGYSAVHGGFEAGGNRWSNSFSKMWSDGTVVCSIATLGTDFVHAGLDEDMGSYLEQRRENDDFQWMSAIRERMWFTGSSGNPTDSSTSSNAEVGVKSNSMPGIASMITERSVISGDTFYTNFNTGHGLVYAIDGEISNTHEWANISIQDILPTWQFWFDTTGTALKAEYDYGTNYKKGMTASWNKGVLVEDSTTYGTFDFDLVDPYNGGSSLAVYGKVDADNFMRLYKTSLDVTDSTKLNITFKKTSTDDVAMSLGLVFADSINAEDNTYTITELPIENTTAASDGWVTATVDLSAYAGKSVAVMGLYFKGTADNYQMHIGQIEYLSGKSLTPSAPTGLTIDKVFDTNEAVISWDLDSYDSVKQYNVYVNDVFVGGIYDETFYIKNLYTTEGTMTIKVTAVGADGTESEAATATYDFSKAVTGLSVVPADGTLTVSFTPADASVATEVSVYVPETKDTYTATAAAGETSVVVTVPSDAAADGKEYEMQVTPENGTSKAYDGELDDSYCVPYDGPMTGHALTSPVACDDWYKMSLTYTTYSGSAGTEEYTRGKKSHGELNNDWSRFQSLPSDIMTLEVTLTDYAGNTSAPVNYNFDDKGEPVIPQPFYRVFHLDAGRKYFSVESIKTILDAMAEANFSQLQLYFSDNQGFRLALDDMTLTTDYGTYDLTPALGDGYTGDNKYPDGTGKYLTQSEMDEIITYANSKGIEIIPALNVPGHMGAILEEFPSLRYTNSKSSIDLTSDEAKAFAKALVAKYADYFASKGCKYFSFGADEFANDQGSSSMGFETIYKNGIYKEHFVPFFNDVAQIIKDKGMTPRAFNDGILYNNDTSVEMDTDVQVCYWSGGWGGYNLASATTLNDAGFELINTNEGFYWVLGNSSWQVSADKAGQFDYTAFPGSTIYNPAGAMLCVWCDNGAADGDDGGAGVAEKIAPVIKAFGGTLPEERSTVPVIDASYFPDPVLRQIVMEQVGPYITDLTKFTGTLDCSGKGVTDLTGLTRITGLTGLNLSGTKITKITSDMLPAGVTSLNLANCKELTFVELNDFPNLVLDFTGCSAVENLYLKGTNMTEVNISAMTRLHNFVISDSQISKITAASAATYKNAYYWNWTGAKMDLSDSTKEGKLRSGMETYFATADLEEEIDAMESAVDHKNSCYGGPIEFVMSQVQQVTKITYVNSYADYSWGANYGMKGGTVEVSTDGETYTQVATFSGNTAKNCTIQLPENTRAMYVRINITDGYGYCGDLNLMGHAVAPMGFSFGKQQPALVRDELTDVSYERNGRQYQLLDILEKNYASFKTVRGTAVADLEGAEWVDESYLADATQMPKGVKVVITDEEGNTYVPSNVEKPDLGTLDETTNIGRQASIVTQSGQYSGEGSANLFDGNKTTTKWCTGGSTGWVGFTLPESMVVGKWVTTHAGMAEQEGYITKAYRLQVLDPDGEVSESDFMGMSSSEQKNVLKNANYWVDLDVVTGNSTNEVSRTIATENLKEAQVYRLYVDQAEQSAGGAVRIYEMELYTYTGKLKTDTNGIFIADEIGTWNVSYRKGANELANLTLRVKMSDQDLVDLSKEVEAAEKAAQEAKEAAENAQKAAEAAKAAAEAAAATSAENKEAAEKAAEEAKAALAKAEAAQRAAEIAEKAAEEARKAAAESNEAAAVEARKAAENAAASAASAASAAESAATAAKAAEAAQKAQAAAEAAAEEARKAALESAKYYALTRLVQIDISDMNNDQKAAARELITAAQKKVLTAETTAEVEQILSDVLAALDQIRATKCAAVDFVDVKEDSWFHKNVDELYNMGIMVGTSSTTFSPYDGLTRGQLVSILYRLSGEPEVTGGSDYSDVPANVYYTKAVIWASQQGIVYGYMDGTFRPDAQITRQELVVLLFRYANAQPGDAELLNAYPDASDVSAFAKEAMSWALENGILYGVELDGTNYLSPKATTNRAQVAAVITRYLSMDPQQ